MSKEPVWSGSPVASAPYTPGIKAGGLVFVSGQVPMDPATRAIVEGGFEDRVRQCIKNVEAVLHAAGASLEDVVKVTVFLTDMDCFARLNAVYSEYWGSIKPARSCVAVAELPLGVDVEIEAIAAVDG
ncbi:MAG: deaminase [Chthonomonadales bacterium]|nr:deaminase [Chthonomonadales bacterium]